MEGISKKEHSQIGIASIYTAVFAIIFTFFSDYSGGDLLFYLLVGLPIISIILSIWGLFQKDQKKILPAIGIALSLLSMFFAWDILFKIL